MGSRGNAGVAEYSGYISGHLDWTKHAQKIWELDGQFQEEMLNLIFECIRHVEDPELLARDVEIAKQDLLFYVPNDDYLPSLLGEEVASGAGYLYNQFGECTLTERLAIPIYDFSDRIRHFIGYDGTAPSDIQENQDKQNDLGDLGDSSEDQEGSSDLEGQEDMYIKYKYPVARALPKSRFMYIRAQEYIQAIEEGYIFVVDGIFDKRRLSAEGYNAVSLMGSALTFWHKLYLSKIRNIIVIPDNDLAGEQLVRKCKRAFSHVSVLRQNITWDIDDFLKSKENINIFRDTFNNMKSGGFILDSFIRRKQKDRSDKNNEREMNYAIKEKKPQRTIKAKTREEQL